MLNKWCSKVWLRVLYVLGVLFLVVSATHWGLWSFGQKLIGAMGVILPLHVLEEWQIPGGFHYQYNLLMKSDTLSCYPMSRLTDMLTNFCGELFFLALLLLRQDGTGTTLALTVFCWLEVVIHTLVGFRMLKQFKSRGKRTFYGPGSLSAYLGFAPAGVAGLLHLLRQPVFASDLLHAVVLLGVMLLGLIVLPENLLKRKDSPYAFSNAGYFEKFLH